MTSSGTLKSLRKNPEAKIPSRETMIVRLPAVQIRATMTCFSFSVLRQPKHWAATRPAPLHSPMTRAVRKQVRVPVLPTPASALAPRKRPTMMVSATL